jgi:hypothetical protein
MTEPNVVYPRFALATTVVVRETANGAAALAKLKNISLSGCYLETPREIPQQSRVRVVLQTADIRADLWGIVQRRDETGIGIRFTNGSTVEDWKALELLIQELEGKIPAKRSAASTTF